MPRLGESVDEGTISKWLKAEGETVKELEPLLEVNTDKVDTEIPSPASGTLIKITAPEGTVAEAGMVIAWIGNADEQPPESGAPPVEGVQDAPAAEAAPTPASQAPAPATEPAPQAGGEPMRPGRHPDLGFISPVVARMAGEHQLDLSQIEGTGAGGRITKKDVQRYLESAPPIRPETPPADAPAAPAAPARPAAPTPVSAARPGEVVPLNNMRKAIAEHMVISKRTSPHVTTVMEVDLHRVAAHRAANKAAFARDGVKLTFTAYFVAATATALRAYPLVNSSWTDDGILLRPDINIGMAVSLGEAGLIVPVLKNVDRLSLLGISQTVNDLAERARARQVRPGEVQGGTFTITNHGVSGSLFASPIINQPQCGILGVGAIQKRVVVVSSETGDSIAIRPMAYVSLTFDHRILDGATADYFLGKVAESLQDWS
jgi:2-oxoglutarate dehydrogenase E2 component (dihydrolipoamide succinyltransferase)